MEYLDLPTTQHHTYSHRQLESLFRAFISDLHASFSFVPDESELWETFPDYEDVEHDFFSLVDLIDLNIESINPSLASLLRNPHPVPRETLASVIVRNDAEMLACEKAGEYTMNFERMKKAHTKAQGEFQLYYNPATHQWLLEL